MTDPDVAQAHLFVALLGEHLREMAPKLAAADRAAVGRTALAQTRRHQAHQLRRDINHARFLIDQLLQRFPEIDATGLDAVLAEAQRLGRASGGAAPVGAGEARSAAPAGADGRRDTPRPAR